MRFGQRLVASISRGVDSGVEEGLYAGCRFGPERACFLAVDFDVGDLVDICEVEKDLSVGGALGSGR